jgi:rhodanese-related sulfurtransferase
MGNSPSIQKISFEDVQYILKNPEPYILINTLNELEQDCLIPYTVLASNEERTINELLKIDRGKNRRIIIYGKNANDEKIYTKYNQLQNLGFYQVFLYTGGLFEWLLLQDVYGSNEFPTTKKELDLLKYKPPKKLNITLLEY